MFAARARFVKDVALGDGRYVARCYVTSRDALRQLTGTSRRRAGRSRSDRSGNRRYGV
ncbi:hypothetical protein BURMUCGD1_5244 [Burkholderia multivorans CGD1]|nr:hypothetical protein BURMUCGD1_5244 [Burkholderia multivorans CGD1]